MQRFRQRTLLFLLLILVGVIWSTLLITTSVQKTLDQRVQEVGAQLKCPVCQGESVADSSSQLAQQMRSIIREQLQAGKSEQEVIQYFVRSYGDEIVWSPPWQGFSLLTWLVPIALILGSIGLLFFLLRDWRSRSPTTSLEGREEEQGVLEQMDKGEVARYRELLEQELAADDPLFVRSRTEAQ
jgi:cytochrome c-type biogenesis protein CcmH